jgi:hypothetical protein
VDACLPADSIMTTSSLCSPMWSGSTAMPARSIQTRSVKCSALGGREIILVLVMLYYTCINTYRPDPLWVHVPTILFLLAGLLNTKRVLEQAKGLLPFAVVVVLLEISAALAADSRRALTAAYYVLGTATFGLIYRHRQPSVHTITILAGLMVPLAVLTPVVLPNYVNISWAFNPTCFLPAEVNSYMVNIGPYGSTVHLSATIALLLLVCTLHECMSRLRLWQIPVIAAALYVVVFSRSRSTYIAVVCCLLVYGLVRARKGSVWSLATISAAIVLIFLSSGPLLQQWVSGSATLQTIVRKDEHEELSSGRDWLWKHHIRIFREHPFGDAPSELLNLQVGTNFEGSTVGASMESFYTLAIAAYGVSGFGIIALHLLSLWRALAARDAFRSAIAAQLILLNAANGMYNNIYNVPSVFVLAVLAPTWWPSRTLRRARNVLSNGIQVCRS